MKSTLRNGDRVAQARGVSGVVTGFRQNLSTGADMVLIRWDNASMDQPYTDGELEVLGVAKDASIR